MQTQNVKVVMLPQNKRGWRTGDTLTNHNEPLSMAKDDAYFGQALGYSTAQHLYFTSDEEIKLNDYISDGYKVWQWKDDSSLLGRRKVIASTDPSLGLPSIPEEWIRNKYVPSNGKIDSVKLEMMQYGSTRYVQLRLTYKNEVMIVDEPIKGCPFDELETTRVSCIRPSNERQVRAISRISAGIEPEHQSEYKRNVVVDKELEDAAEKHTRKFFKKKNDYVRESYIGSMLQTMAANYFKAGADWKEKRMWTDEDMLAFAAYQGQKATSNKGFYFESEALQWLEDYKKKRKSLKS